VSTGIREQWLRSFKMPPAFSIRFGGRSFFGGLFEV
jgi:hypothetical protein